MFTRTLLLKAVLSDVADHFLEAFCKLLEIFLVKENLVLVVCKMTIAVYPALAFCDRQIIVITLCGLDVKKYVRFPALTGFEKTSSPERSRPFAPS